MEDRPTPMTPDQAERRYAEMLEEAGLPRFTSAIHDAASDELRVAWDHGLTIYIDLACWEMDPIDDSERAAILGLAHDREDREPIHVTVPGSADDPRLAASIPGVVVHRVPPLHPDDAMVYNGIPVTSPSRTLIDLLTEARDRHERAGLRSSRRGRTRRRSRRGRSTPRSWRPAVDTAANAYRGRSWYVFQHALTPSRRGRRVRGSRGSCPVWFEMLVVASNAQQVEDQLAAGRLACPGCGERLSPWGFTGWRSVRTGSGVRRVRLRRTTCGRCRATHVLLPAWMPVRRRDAVEVIGAALALAAHGVGHRRIAGRLDRPPETVRGWLRCARRNAQALRSSAARWWIALDPEPGPVRPAGCELADTVEAMMLAVRAWTLRFGPDRAGPWERVQSLTGGLLSATPGLPP